MHTLEMEEVSEVERATGVCSLVGKEGLWLQRKSGSLFYGEAVVGALALKAAEKQT